MRQVCNISYVAQAEGLIEDGELERFQDELYAEIGEKPRRRGFVAPELDRLMPRVGVS